MTNDLATLQAERERGAWYARRVYEHQAAARANARTTGAERAAILADESRHHAINDHDLWVMHRVAQIVACAEAGENLATTARLVGIEPNSLVHWLRANGHGQLLAQLRGGQVAA